MNIDQIKILLIDFGLVGLVVWLASNWDTSIKDSVLAPWRRRRGTGQNLAEWLEIAAGKLVPSAQARIRAEIEVHYAEAVKSCHDAGLPEANAQAVALADLGNPYAAARKYNGEYLTKEETKRVASYFADDDLTDPPPPIVQRNRFLKFLNGNWLLVLVFCATLLIGLATRLDSDTNGFQGFHVIIMVCMLTSLLLTGLISKKLWQGGPELAGQKITPALLSRLILLDSLERLGWAAFWTSIFYVYVGSASSHSVDIMLALLTAALAVRCSARAIKLLRLRRKILSSDADGLELPPHNPTIA
ncbi:MAG: hypothetical protein ACRD3S_19645 [Terracidiphilus sp.]